VHLHTLFNQWKKSLEQFLGLLISNDAITISIIILGLGMDLVWTWSYSCAKHIVFFPKTFFFPQKTPIFALNIVKRFFVANDKKVYDDIYKIAIAIMLVNQFPSPIVRACT